MTRVRSDFFVPFDFFRCEALQCMTDLLPTSLSVLTVNQGNRDGDSITSGKEKRPFFAIAGVICIASSAALRWASGKRANERDSARWDNRSQLVRTARFTWTVKVISNAGPVKNWTRTLAFDRERLKFTWQVNDARWQNRAFTFDPATNQRMSFFATNNPDRIGYPEGTVEPSESFTDLDIAPLLWMYRLGDTNFFGKSFDLTWNGDRVVAQGRDCLILRRIDAANPEVSHEYWVSKSIDWAVVRYRIVVRGKSAFEINLTYVDGNERSLGPSGWNAAVLKPQGGVRLLHNASIVDCELNVDIPNHDLSIEFPPGTIVQDKVEDKSYFIQRDATRRELTDAEKRMNYVSFLRRLE